MRITIYKQRKYESYDFKPQELDKVKDFCYNNNIKYYTISYNDKEIIEYERLSKRNNQRNR